MTHRSLTGEEVRNLLDADDEGEDLSDYGHERDFESQRKWPTRPIRS